ncbi:SAF domain-containing protein [Cellulomonas sp. S1-8]|uniref:SAF domain-containing protein n=1 Tax=Cellulomonas sp. S1-8 TaxID=2904790 RepID=UPI0022430C3B|nr:SAF domain-containing protein [Cellulomonas sp. S1-8]UZN04238.1 SAF domain-containing protein [Cellulomonas sp. S1-8]
MALLTAAVSPRHDAAASRPPPLPHGRPPTRLRVRALAWRTRFAVAALFLGIAAGVTVHTLRPPPAASVPVVVLARDVAAGSALVAADLEVVDVPPGVAPAGALPRTGDAAGRVTAVDLPARLPLTPALLADSTLTGPPGTVVVAVRLDDAAVADLLEPGLHLDLVAARLEGGPGETVARRALVRPAPADTSTTAGLLSGGAAADDGPPVLVAVTPAEAVRIAEASVSSRLVAVVVP